MEKNFIEIAILYRFFIDNDLKIYHNIKVIFGVLAEWLKAPSWKGGISKGIIGSNPIYSAKIKIKALF